MSAPANTEAPAWARPMLDFFDHRLAEQTRREPFRRRSEVVERYAPHLRRWCTYFDTEIEGWDHLPDDGPFMVVGNHSGGAETNDAAFFLCRWVAERGAEAPIYVLAYDLLFGLPGIGPLLPALGAVPACPSNARAALDRGDPVMVFPGGDHEVFRPWSHRNRIEFGGHEGFVRVALECRVPVVPMTIHGAHQSTFILTRGEGLARRLGLGRLRVHGFPIIWSIPFGPTPAFVPTVPLPAKVTVAIGEPFDWSDIDPAAADDPAVVDACYAEVTAAMQADMDRLDRATPHPVAARLQDWMGRTTRPVGRLLPRGAEPASDA